MLRWRLLSAGVIIALAVSLAALDFLGVVGAPPGTWLLLLLLLITVLGTEECLSLLAAKNLRPAPAPVYFGTLAVVVAFAWPVFWYLAGGYFLPLVIADNLGSEKSPAGDISPPLVVLALAVVLVFVAELRRFDRPGQHVVHIALALFTIGYLGVLGGFLIALRLFHGDNGLGITALVSMLVVVKMSDAGAYAFGRLLGATKLTPKLSPGKTVEGAIGGVATGCVASWAFFQFIAPELIAAHSQWVRPTWLATMVYGLVLSLAAMIGDLTESLLKRDMERKDSSTWLPGLGGVLDIMDSILVAAPVAYLCWEWGLVS